MNSKSSSFSDIFNKENNLKSMQNKANPKLTNNVFVQERFVMDDAQKKLLNKFDFVKAKDQSQF